MKQEYLSEVDLAFGKYLSTNLELYRLAYETVKEQNGTFTTTKNVHMLRDLWRASADWQKQRRQKAVGYP